MYPFCDWVVFIVWLYHIGFVHSSVNGHLGGFPILATVNNATVTTGM